MGLAARLRALKFNALLGSTLLLTILLVATATLLFGRHDALETDLLNRFAGPSGTHWFGTDEYGRDIFARVAAGTFVSLRVSALAVALAVFLGCAAGLPSGYFGGWTDRMIMLLNDSIMAFPGLLLVLGIMAALGPNEAGVIIALGLAYSPPIVRIVRGTVFSLREKEYVEASRLIGNSELTTLVRHILPNCVTPLIVIGTSVFTSALLSETALSFLGLGVPPPAPSWGSMLADSRNYLGLNIWMSIFPGVAVTLCLLSINLIGDSLRDRLDPRMKGL